MSDLDHGTQALAREPPRSPCAAIVADRWTRVPESTRSVLSRMLWGVCSVPIGGDVAERNKRYESQCGVEVAVRMSRICSGYLSLPLPLAVSSGSDRWVES